MKLLFTCLLTFIFYFSADCQPINVKYVPEKVITTFDHLYPGAKKISWEKEKENYSATFERNKKNYKTTFTEEGIWLRTSEVLTEEDIPQNARDYMDQNYKDHTFSQVAVEDRIDGKFYTIDIITKKHNYRLLFDLQGNFIKEEKLKE